MILNEKSQFHRLTEMARIGEFVCGDLFLINVNYLLPKGSRLRASSTVG